MTEKEWLACTDPRPMLAFLKDRASDRKLRLFATACCRKVWPLLTVHGSRKAVEVAERYADGEASDRELSAAAADVWTSASSAPEESAARAAAASVWLDAVAASNCTAVAAACSGPKAEKATKVGRHRFPLLVQVRDAARAIHCNLLRDLFGPTPFRQIHLDPAWLTWQSGVVVQLARAAYDNRDLPIGGTLDGARLAVLADALEEAGCQDVQILGHCRQLGGVHVRGCWLIDLLLGKE